MSNATTPRIARDRLVECLRRELMGPSDPREVISEYPTSRYTTGRLAPARESDEDMEPAISETENDSLGAGTDDDDGGTEDTSPPLTIGFNPSSFGLSFLVDPVAEQLSQPGALQGAVNNDPG